MLATYLHPYFSNLFKLVPNSVLTGVEVEKEKAEAIPVVNLRLPDE